MLGRQFVLGRSIDEAMNEAAAARKARGGLRFSYDMLGEGARTEADARRYLASYLNAIRAIAAGRVAPNPQAADGISIKLSALFSRYEDAQRERVFAELLPRVWQLIEPAAVANINLTIDAEESDRLELSLDVFETLARRIAHAYPQWHGFGLAVQAYQTRALQVVDEVARIARAHSLRFMVRLVKGAYWDGEIKRAQEQGLVGYPVFTHKHHTDISYLACARALIAHADVIYPQFATHNAGTIAAIVGMARTTGAACEMQRLHGMGESVYREVSRYADSAAVGPASTPPTRAGDLNANTIPVRVYAPVGEHRDLLAYLVRRLLENGANSSFVHQLADPAVDVDALLASPLVPAARPGIAPPAALYGWDARAPGLGRPNSTGVDLACLAQREPLDRALAATTVAAVPEATPAEVDVEMARLHGGFDTWNRTALGTRAAVLRRAADALEARAPEFCGLLVKEAHKTLGDGVAELREAVDFCRYYAEQAQARLAPQMLPGPTGESNELHLHGRGVFVCISPWNFPLAIFMGQVVAALAAGNAVIAKPADQTVLIGYAAVKLLHEAGVPEDVLQFVPGKGSMIGNTLLTRSEVAGVCMTGSTETAWTINRTLAARNAPIAALIAETGGQNALIADSSALPEQLVKDAVASAFDSAGQRCSAARVLFVQDDIADKVIAMLSGAMDELKVGDPGLLSTDVGPVIDEPSRKGLADHAARMDAEAMLIKQVAVGPESANGTFLAPRAYELKSLSQLTHEVFGPILHVLRWKADELDAVIDQINATGFGLTLGIHSRIDSTIAHIVQRAKVGNCYVNRNQIGAVVGVQPFGGENLSGTGPKAGGPHYLLRFVTERTLTVNTTAAGGNASLLTLGE